MMTQVLVTGTWITILSFLFLKLPFFTEMFEIEAQHLTAFFSMFVLSAVFNGFNVRSEGVNIFEHISENKGFTKVMGIIVLVQIALTLIGGELFSCSPFGVAQWGVILLLSSTVIPFDILRKILFKLK